MVGLWQHVHMRQESSHVVFHTMEKWYYSRLTSKGEQTGVFLGPTQGLDLSFPGNCSQPGKYGKQWNYLCWCFLSAVQLTGSDPTFGLSSWIDDGGLEFIAGKSSERHHLRVNHHCVGGSW